MHKVFVGTMHSNENEFNESQRAIDEQKNVHVEKFVVSGLNEKQAAITLYSEWNKRKHDFDCFAQVDADTVLLHENVIYDACKALKANVACNCLQAPLLDFLTNRFINGLNFYESSVVFNVVNDELRTDRCTTNTTWMFHTNEYFPISLYPAGHHSPNPSLLQAYHFGVHRGLKNHRNYYYNDILRAFKLTHSIQRAYALFGFNDCMKHKEHFNYTDVELVNAFNEIRYDERVKEL